MTDLHCYECRLPVTNDDIVCPDCQAVLVLYDEYPVLGVLRPASDNGIVYKARHRRLQVDLVVKQAPPRLAGYIRNEAKILQSLRRRLNFTPHVYDFREERTYTALVMDFIDGLTLDRVYPQQLWPAAEVGRFV